jgi:RNA polymerase sigma factor (sigma-70 family)
MNSRLPFPPGIVLPIRSVGEDSVAAKGTACLVARIQQGSESAMRELYELVRACAGPYFRWRLGSPGVRNEMDDRLHDTYLVAVEAILTGTIREPERLVGFIRTVVRYQATMAIRRAAHGRKTFEPAEDHPVADQRPTPERSHLEAERYSMMHSLLQEMNGRDREILERFYMDGHSPARICAEMKLTSTQFRLYKSRAKARFSTLALERISGPVRTLGAA